MNQKAEVERLKNEENQIKQEIANLASQLGESGFDFSVPTVICTVVSFWLKPISSIFGWAKRSREKRRQQNELRQKIQAAKARLANKQSEIANAQNQWNATKLEIDRCEKSRACVDAKIDNVNNRMSLIRRDVTSMRAEKARFQNKVQAAKQQLVEKTNRQQSTNAVINSKNQELAKHVENEKRLLGKKI